MIKISTAGGYDQLVYTDLPECNYTEGANIGLEKIDSSDCVVVATHACGVNYADCIIRWGLYKSAKDLVGWPITPGFEFSGTIAHVGENVTDYKIGDKVAGVSLFGSYSKRIQVPAYQIRHVPENISMSEAAGFLTVGLTAHYAIFELCKLRKGDYVLVHSAAGGVGSMLVQMLKNKIGCHVVGVVGQTHKVEMAKQLGCDDVIDKSTQDLWSTAADLTVNGYKAIFDANGVETLQQSYDNLARGGRLVTYGAATMMPKSSEISSGAIKTTDWMKLLWKYKTTPTFNPLDMTSENKSVMAFNLSYMFNEKELLKELFTELFQWISDGSLKVAKVTEFLMTDAGGAHRALESGSTVGKLVLLTEGDKPMQEMEVEENKNEAKNHVESDETKLL